MNEFSNNIIVSQLNKSLCIARKYEELILSLKEYVSLNGFRLSFKNQLISVFNDQITFQKKIIIIKYSFFKYDYSLLYRLLDLTSESISTLLVMVFKEIYKGNYDNKKILIKP